MLPLRSRPLLTLHLDIPADRFQPIGALASGERRLIAGIGGGHFEGERLRGTVLPGGADWLIVEGDGTWRIDVRLTLRTDDEALIYLRYRGVVHASPEVMARFTRREPVAYEEYYARMVPRFETGAAAYAWLNRIVAVGNGERLAAGARYHLHEIL